MVTLRFCCCCALGWWWLSLVSVASAGGIELILTSSHGWQAEYHTSATDKAPVLHLEVANDTEREVVLPPDYDGKVIRLWAKSAEQHRAVMLIDWKRKAPAEMLHLAPGKTHTCFALPLGEILTTPRDEKKWQWTWHARSFPPGTPIMPFKPGEYVKSIVIWAEVVVDGQSLRSEPLVIPVITTR